MKKSSLILLNLITVLEMKSIEARYVLIEVVQEQAILGQSRKLEICPFGRTYECRPQAVNIPLGHEPFDKFVLTCSLNEIAYAQGNRILYNIRNDGNYHLRLELEEVAGVCCEPKPEQCHCNALLRRILEENPNIERIDGQFMADPFMAGCRCYLGVAADFEFKWVEDCDEVNSERMEFTRTNYVQVCEKLKKRKCKGKNARLYKI